MTGPNPIARLRAAVEVAFLDDIPAADGEHHEFEIDTDGDGWTEPFSVHAACACRGWQSTWFQTDPQQVDRPETADLLLAWYAHIEAATACADCDGTGTTVQGWTDKGGFAEDQHGPCPSCRSAAR